MAADRMGFYQTLADLGKLRVIWVWSWKEVVVKGVCA